MPEDRPPLILRLAVFLAVSALVAAGGWWGWTQSQRAAVVVAAKAKGAQRVIKAKVTRENFAVDLVAVGTALADEAADISANVTETVTALHFVDGQKVSKGDLLVELSDAEEQAALGAAKAELAEHEREMARLRDLVRDGAAAQARLEERMTLLDVAKQRVIQAQARVTERRITAPFEGYLGLRRISVGALVSPGTVIVSLDKIDSIKVDFSVPETYLGLIKPGDLVKAVSDSAQSTQVEGRLLQLDTRIDPATRAVAARAVFENRALQLRPGMLLTARMQVAPRSSLAVPERALVPVGEKAYVFAIEAGRAKRVEIKAGRRRPGILEVLSGVNQGVEVVADGLVGLQDGMAVEVSGEYQGPVAAFRPESLEGHSN
jgi:membrane fusion protein (multidrug efflux system)